MAVTAGELNAGAGGACPSLERLCCDFCWRYCWLGSFGLVATTTHPVMFRLRLRRRWIPRTPPQMNQNRTLTSRLLKLSNPERLQTCRLPRFEIREALP